MFNYLLQFVAICIAIFAALISFAAVLSLQEQTKAQVLLNCLNSYIAILKNKTKVNGRGSRDMCFEYYRELFDLHWTEYQIWKMGTIRENVMKAWLANRLKNFKDDYLLYKDVSGNKKLTYREVWEELVRTEYFIPGDMFIKVMNLSHDNKIDEALKL